MSERKCCMAAVRDNDEECGMPLPCPDHPREAVNAYAEWDDPDAFRVFLMYSDDTSEPVEAEYHTQGEWTLNQRLYYAMVLANPRDFVGKPTSREIGWPTKPPAERAAKAANKELKRIAKGEPPPDPIATADGLRFATIAMPRKAARARR